MLRLLILLLLLANGLYYAWSHGYLAPAGFAPATQSEPQRLAAQIKPDAVRLLAPGEAKRLDAPLTAPSATVTSAASTPSPETTVTAPVKPAECLQTPVLGDTLAIAARAAASASLPSDAWTLQSATEPARWIIYMGKFAGTDLLEKKKAELRQIGVSFEPLKNANLELGISLGGFETQAEAQAELNALAKQGVRTAKVVQESAATRGQVLKLPAVDDGVRSKLGAVKSALGNVVLRTCKP
jgi:hypothetical protein